MKYIYYFYRPQLIDQFWKLELAEGEDPAQLRKTCTFIAAAGQYCFAVFEQNNEVYSWGMGENYVLGNRDDCNQFTPYLLDPRMFEENPVIMMALGTMHAVALAKESPSAVMPKLDSSLFVEVEAKTMVVSPKPIKKVNGDHLDDVKSQRS